MKKCILIIGGTSEIGAECCKLWIKKEPDISIFLIGRNEIELKKTKEKLKSNNSSEINTLNIDCLDLIEISRTIKEIASSYSIFRVLFAIGTIEKASNVDETKKLLEINGISPIIFSELLIPFLNNSSKLIFLSSIASERGRRSNFIYGAGKSMLATYVEGLQHKYCNNEFQIKLLKLGPIKTRMFTASKSSAPFSLELTDAAKKIVRSELSNKSVIYIPKKWKYLMFIIRNIPSKLFNKIDI
jgi:decaprenylphospho-beta-D-erythro-pentofuranosid-2-ulose 2-reductase